MKTKRNNVKGFWDKERCEYCRGILHEKETELLKKHHGTYVIFRHVPAGICQSCGTRYFSANVLKIVSEKLRRGPSNQKKVEVSLLDLSAA